MVVINFENKRIVDIVVFFLASFLGGLGGAKTFNTVLGKTRNHIKESKNIKV